MPNIGRKNLRKSGVRIFNVPVGLLINARGTVLVHQISPLVACIYQKAHFSLIKSAVFV
jgi:hypothetical protein